jgi:hypothetical protein
LITNRASLIETGTPLAWYLMCYSCCPEFSLEPRAYIPRGLSFMNLLFALRIISAATLVRCLMAQDLPAMRLELEESRKNEVDLLKKFKEDAARDMATPFFVALAGGGPQPPAGGGGGGGGGSSSSAAAATATGPTAAGSPGPAACWRGCSPALTNKAEHARAFLQSIPYNYTAAVFMIQFFAYVFYFLDEVADSEQWKTEFKEWYMAPEEGAEGEEGGGGASAAAAAAAVDDSKKDDSKKRKFE